MAGIVRVLSRNCLLRQTSALVSRRSNMATKRMTAYEEMNQYWVKNRQLVRPLSPHLSIYGYHLTMVMSITNRVMGVAMQGVIVGGSVLLLVAPVDFKSVVQWIKNLNLNGAIIYAAKYIVAIPFSYHLLCGIRHLVWDSGHGFKGPTIIKGGYGIIAATAVLASALVFGIKPSML